MNASPFRGDGQDEPGGLVGASDLPPSPLRGKYTPPPPQAILPNSPTTSFSGPLADPYTPDFADTDPDPLASFSQYSSSPYNHNVFGPGTTPAPSNNDNNNNQIQSGVVPPLLSVDFFVPPPFAIVPPPPGNGSGPDMTNPEQFSIDLQSLWDAENIAIGIVANTVSIYEMVRRMFEENMDWIFGQQAVIPVPTVPANGDDPSEPGDSYEMAPPSYGPTPMEADPIQSTAQTFADGDGTNSNPGINNVQGYVLKQIAEATETVGLLLATMQKAGSSYATADSVSVFPSEILQNGQTPQT